jgi:hypothetical protein
VWLAARRRAGGGTIEAETHRQRMRTLRQFIEQMPTTFGSAGCVRHPGRVHYRQSYDSPTVMDPRGGRAVCQECGRCDDAVIRPLFVVRGASGSGKRLCSPRWPGS